MFSLNIGIQILYSNVIKSIAMKTVNMYDNIYYEIYLLN